MRAMLTTDRPAYASYANYNWHAYASYANYNYHAYASYANRQASIRELC